MSIKAECTGYLWNDLSIRRDSIFEMQDELDRLKRRGGYDFEYRIWCIKQGSKSGMSIMIHQGKIDITRQ